MAFDTSHIECWIRTRPLSDELWFCKTGNFQKSTGWKRLRVSQKGGYWSGTTGTGRKYRVPFDVVAHSDFGLATCFGSAKEWLDAEPPSQVNATKSGGVTLEELFAEDEE